ncbi:MAG: hypothetical protein EHM61_04165 [Acidobacteria bacterium]|nr:MAG: hypothetical protein EHM61_04165 [Acidobacteriota bacterium]
MHVGHSLLAISMYSSLSLFVFSQATPSQALEVIYGETLVEWPSYMPDRGLSLTVSGPEGLYLKQEHPAGTWARFGLLDAQGLPRADGVYKWELVVQAGWEAAGDASARQVQSGWFRLQGGRVTGEGTPQQQPLVVEETAPYNSLYVDGQGRLGIGTTVPGAQLHLKGAVPSLALEDTHAGGREYFLRSYQGGDGSLGLFDETAGKVRWLVDAEGRMGINTVQPNSTLTVDGYIEATKGFLVNGRPLSIIGGFGGVQPLSSEGYGNNFFGTGAGASNAGDNNNSFFGGDAGFSNTTGASNSFFGYHAGRLNNTGYYNSAFGRSAGAANTTGQSNSFFGHFAGDSNISGNENSAFGASAGAGNNMGSTNTFVGARSGQLNTEESNNTFIGAYAELDPGSSPAINPVTNVTAIGYRSYVSRSNSLILGGVMGINGATAETFVGIGTPSPDRQLVVEGSQALGKFRRYSAVSSSHAPAFLFERARGTNISPSNILPGDYLGKVQFRAYVNGTTPEYGALVFAAADANQNGRFAFVDRDLTTERMVILNTGNVGIGTSTPTALLDVAGSVRIRGSISYGQPASSVPDYVFESDYRLMPLRQLGQYVKTEKHLPNIPKASEIQDNGVNLGEFQMKLLEKIEELTLYTVEQANVIERQREEAGALRAETTALELEAAGLRARTAGQESRIKALEEIVKTLVEKESRRK